MFLKFFYQKNNLIFKAILGDSFFYSTTIYLKKNQGIGRSGRDGREGGGYNGALLF